MSPQDLRLAAVSYDSLPHWREEKQDEALEAFYTSSRRLLLRKSQDLKPSTPDDLLTICSHCVQNYSTLKTRENARRFFEDHFIPHRIIHSEPLGLLTGYYEPQILGSRAHTERFKFPLLRRPRDLVNLVAESERGAFGDQLTHARQTPEGLKPYFTRAEIEKGALDGQGLEFMWLEDRVDVFFLHIQGSGLIRFEDGSKVRITYDGKNGHPYTSVGRYLIEAGFFSAEKMTLQTLKEWLRSDEKRGISAMHQNRSFIFFRELIAEEGSAPLGAMEIPLTPLRSLAIDTLYHSIGTPIFVTVPEWRFGWEKDGFYKLMIGQDVGSAIRGPERGDIFFGTGDEAGNLAGITKHRGTFFLFVPRAPS